MVRARDNHRAEGVRHRGPRWSPARRQWPWPPAAASLLDDGHDVVVHARSEARLVAVGDLLAAGAGHVVGDLGEL